MYLWILVGSLNTIPWATCGDESATQSSYHDLASVSTHKNTPCSVDKLGSNDRKHIYMFWIENQRHLQYGGAFPIAAARVLGGIVVRVSRTVK